MFKTDLTYLIYYTVRPMQRKIKIGLDYLSAQKSSILLFVLSRGRILRCAIGNSTEAEEMAANRRVM